MSASKLSREKLQNCKRTALKVAAGYAVFGMFWILFSDRFLESIIQDMALMGMIQTVKGGFYVLLTAVLVGLAVYRYAAELLEMEEERIQRETRYESRLHSARIILKTVMDAAPDLIFVKDRSGTYEHCNTAFTRFIGHPEKMILGCNDNDFFSPEEAAFFWECDAKVFESGRIQRKSTWVTYPDGSRVFLDVYLSPYHSSSGQVHGLIGVARDITEEYALHEELHRAKDAAEASSRAKSLFLANMSHEIRTPLNGVVGAIQLLEEGEHCPEHQDLLVMARNAAFSLQNLIQDLLDLAQIEAGKLRLVREPVQMREILTSCTAMFAKDAQTTGTELVLDLDDKIPEMVQGDKGRLIQILTNLIGNAIKFCRRGRIEVVGRVLRLDTQRESVQILLSVTDTGVGIPEEKLAGVFDTFSQVDETHARKYQGLGLGLGIVRELVAAMGGEIVMESEEGQGTGVYISLPFPVMTGRRHDGKRVIGHSGEQHHFLIAEDNPVNSALLQKMIESRGHTCTVVTNGRDVLEISGKFRAVLMDIQMPEMDGLEATKRIRNGESRLPAGIPIVAVTAHAMKEDRERIVAVGMDYYLEKPVSLKALDRFLTSLFESCNELQ